MRNEEELYLFIKVAEIFMTERKFELIGLEFTTDTYEPKHDTNMLRILGNKEANTLGVSVGKGYETKYIRSI